MPDCPECNCEYVYSDGLIYICPECSFEWDMASVNPKPNEDTSDAVDSNENKLLHGKVHPLSRQ